MLKKYIAATLVGVTPEGVMTLECEIGCARVVTSVAQHCQVEFKHGNSDWMLILEVRRESPRIGTRVYAELADDAGLGVVGWVTVQEFDITWNDHKRTAQSAGVILRDPQRPEELYGLKRAALQKRGALPQLIAA